VWEHGEANSIDSHAWFYSAWGEWVGTGIGELCVDDRVEIEKPVKGGDTFDWLLVFLFLTMQLELMPTQFQTLLL